MLQVKVIKSTVIKSRPIQSSQLGTNDKFQGKVGDILDIESYELERNNHYRVLLKEQRNAGKRVYYCYREHIEILDGSKVITPQLASTTHPLLIPYHSQLDNWYNPTGACNVTSLAMCLEYLKVRASTNLGLDDELYHFMESRGLDRHDPVKLAECAELYGVKDTFSPRAGVSDAKKALSEGKPCIVHGYFTEYGHIIVLCGFNSIGFICHDPYGKLDAYDTYNTKVEGRFVTYPYHQFTRLAMPDNYLWLHILEPV